MSGTVTVVMADDGFLEITRETHKFGVNLRSTLVIEASSALAVADHLEALADTLSPSQSTLDVGGDHLEVVIGGAEQDPVFNCFNRRFDESRRPGESVVALYTKHVAAVVGALRAAVDD